MMGFCKCVHSLIGFQAAYEPWRTSPHHCRSLHPSGSEGMRLFAAEPWKPLPLEKVDASARGLHDCCYGDGLRLCTECLGSESCDGGLEAVEVASASNSAETEEEDYVFGEDEEVEEDVQSARRRQREDRKDFPPPLRWLGGMGGRRTGFMRAERKDGRLILTEVWIERPKIFSISREDGRLKLHLIESDGSDEQPAEGVEAMPTGEEKEKATVAEEEEEDEEGRTERWEWRRGEGYRRCQDAAGGNSNVQVWWNHRFLTTAG